MNTEFLKNDIKKPRNLHGVKLMPSMPKSDSKMLILYYLLLNGRKWQNFTKNVTASQQINIFKRNFVETNKIWNFELAFKKETLMIRYKYSSLNFRFYSDQSYNVLLQ